VEKNSNVIKITHSGCFECYNKILPLYTPLCNSKPVCISFICATQKKISKIKKKGFFATHQFAFNGQKQLKHINKAPFVS